jgi:YHS domain-containing protein
MLRFVILLLVLWWVFTLLRSVIAWIFGSARSQQGQPNSWTGQQQPQADAHRLVRDPVCNVHVPQSRALPLKDREEVLYFCSATCRDRYIEGTKKAAANG